VRQGVYLLTLPPFEKSQNVEKSQRPVTSAFPEFRKYENRFVAAPAVSEQSHHRDAEDADVPAPEAEIDRLVYSLYGPTREEVAIIEESLQEKTTNGKAANDAAVEE
jgi:hypothetical protein